MARRKRQEGRKDRREEHFIIYCPQLGCGWRRRPPVVEGSCEYIE
jgi:hypothetical protein